MLMLMIINPDFLQIWAFACVWSSTIYLHCKYIRKKATCIQEAWEGKVKAVVKAGWFGFSCSCGCHLPRSRKQTWHETFANKQTFENHVKYLTSYIHLEKRVHICIYIYTNIYIYIQYIYTCECVFASQVIESERHRCAQKWKFVVVARFARSLQIKSLTRTANQMQRAGAMCMRVFAPKISAQISHAEVKEVRKEIHQLILHPVYSRGLQ